MEKEKDINMEKEKDITNCMDFLKKARADSERLVSSELKLLEKIVVVDLFDPDQIGASKMYMNSLIRSALEEVGGKPNIAHASRPRVIVLDGRYFFNEHEFVNRFVEEKRKLEQVQIFRPLDDLTLLMTVEVNVKLNLAVNLNCQLVVIIPHSKTIFPDLLRTINKILYPEDIHINVLFLVESLGQKKLEIFKGVQHIEVISCEYELPDYQENTPRKKGPIRASKEEKLSITSSQSNTHITKVIRFRS